ncbi:MAG: hypothetical protein C4341_05860 [Armatimonadota bacterium]
MAPEPVVPPGVSVVVEGSLAIPPALAPLLAGAVLPSEELFSVPPLQPTNPKTATAAIVIIIIHRFIVVVVTSWWLVCGQMRCGIASATVYTI